jgi:uncharacterized membrane protein YfcA
MSDPGLAVLVGTTFLLAGLIKGVIGLGLPTVAMGLLGLVMPPVEAAALLIVPSLVTNVWQLIAGRQFAALLRRLWPLLVGVVVGTVGGSAIIASTAARAATAGLGLALIIYAATGLARPRMRVPPAAERWAAPLVGVATGLVTGATGVFVIPAVPYIGSLGLGRDDLVQALGLSFTVSTLALAVGLVLHGALSFAATTTSLFALAPALTGMALGGWLRARFQPEIFRLCFFVGLFALGGELIWRGLA